MLLCVSFGTTYAESRERCIGGIEKALAAAFPEQELRRAFTSKFIIRKLEKRDGIKIDQVDTALLKMQQAGVTEVLVQPTHLISGFEYTKVMDSLRQELAKFKSIRIGRPLLSSGEDFQRMADILAELCPAERAGKKTAYAWMGHGSDHQANLVYERLKEILDARGLKQIMIGTVESKPDVTDVISELQAYQPEHVVLRPLMVVAGDHATNDMAGSEPESWRSQIEAAGFSTEAVLEGLGELPEVQALYVEHAKKAVELRPR
ncbi:MAG: sirohydrochlorin cobaltochelatase [Eubacteriales bacterium]|nr:sirohydrochlorin cobaltochelatase [Eubacteriales bacterium]